MPQGVYGKTQMRPEQSSAGVGQRESAYNAKLYDLVRNGDPNSRLICRTSK